MSGAWSGVPAGPLESDPGGFVPGEERSAFLAGVLEGVELGRVGPAGRGLARRAGHLDGADDRLVDLAGAGSGAGAVSGVGICLSLDVICSIFMSCLVIAVPVPRSTRRMSMLPLSCWTRGLRRLRQPACWPGGWAARSGRRAVTWPRPRNRAGFRSRTSPRCSRSGFPSGWPRRSGTMPGRPGAPSRRSPRRPWRSSSGVLTGTARRDEGAAGGGGIRLQPSRGGRNVSGLRDLGAAAAGQDRRPGGGRRKR